MNRNLVACGIVSGLALLGASAPAVRALCEYEEEGLALVQAVTDEAQAEADLAAGTYERVANLFQQGAATQRELDDASAALAAAQAHLAACLSCLELAQAALDDCRLLPLSGQPARVGVSTADPETWRWASLIEPTGRYFLTSQAFPAQIGTVLTFGNGEARAVADIKPVLMWGLLPFGLCFAVGELESPLTGVAVETWWNFPGKSFDPANPVADPRWENVSDAQFSIFGSAGPAPIHLATATGPVSEIDQFIMGSGQPGDPNGLVGAPVFYGDKLFGLFYPDLAHEQQTGERKGVVAIVSEIYAGHFAGIPGKVFTEVPLRLDLTREDQAGPLVLTIHRRWPAAAALFHSPDLQTWTRAVGWPGVVRVDSTPWRHRIDCEPGGGGSGSTFWQAREEQ